MTGAIIAVPKCSEITYITAITICFSIQLKDAMGARRNPDGGIDHVSREKMKPYPTSRRILWSYPESCMTFTLFESRVPRDFVANPVFRG